LEYLYNGSETAQGLIDGLVNDNDFLVVIDYSDGSTETNGNGPYVEFNNTSGKIVDDGTQSPAIGLVHELGHRENLRKSESQTRKRHETPDPKFDTKEEKKVITEIEQPVVDELNKNGNNEGRRDNHRGTPVKVDCSTCNDF